MYNMNTLDRARVIIALKIRQVYRCGGGVNFYGGGGHSFLDFDDA